MALLTGIRLPIEWVQFGFESATSLGDVVLTSGKVAWAWEEEAPDFGIASFHPPTSDEADGWGMDHVVLVVPDMDRAVDTLQATGADLRLRTVVRERPDGVLSRGDDPRSDPSERAIARPLWGSPRHGGAARRRRSAVAGPGARRLGAQRRHPNPPG